MLVSDRMVVLWLLLLLVQIVSSRNNSTFDEELVATSSYMYNGVSEFSQLLSPGQERTGACYNHEALDIVPYQILKCGENGTLLVRTGHCVTIADETDTLEVGTCMYNYNTSDTTLYTELPKSTPNDFMCKASGLHRTGTLCGKCEDGYYPLAYSYDMKCVQCPNGKSNWWKFVLAAFLPLTIFYVVVLFFKINVASSRFQGFLFYSQMFSLPVLVRLIIVGNYNKSKNETAIRCLVAFCGFWNLDFFRSINFGICLGTDTLQTLALDFIVGAYPLLLMMVSYFLIELHDRNFRPIVIIGWPLRRFFGLFQENWGVRSSLIDAFVTTFLLTNVKFQSVSFDLLTPVKVYHLNTTGNWTYSV